MIKFKKKMKYLKGFILYTLLCVFAFLPFMSFNVNAWSLDSNGNLVSDNLISSDVSFYEQGAIANQVGVSYSGNKVSLNTRLRIKNLFNLDSSLTYTISVASGFDVNVQAYNDNGKQSSQSSSPYNTWGQSWTFTGYDYYAFAFRYDNNATITTDVLDNIEIMLVEGSSVIDYEPYDAVYYSQENYNNVAQDLLGGLEGYDAIDLYYLDSITYVSTDNGQTFTNANNQDVSNNYVYGLFDRNNLIIDKDNPWNANAIYMVRVNFSQPLFLWRLQILNSAKPTTFLKVVCNDLTITNFNYFVDTEQGNTSYIISDNIFQTCDSVEFYFKINQYVSGTSTSWMLDYKGYNVGIDSYNEGYRDGQDSMSTQIDDLKSNINILKQQITSLNKQLSKNFGWQSLFFGMADTPLYTVSQMLGFEVLGVNLFNAFIGFITVLAILWVLKRLVK